MKIKYANHKVEKLCTNPREAKKCFGDDIAHCLFSRICFIKAASSLEDLRNYKPLHFHQLDDEGHRKYKGCFAIDVKSRTQPFRIILQPLDNQEKAFTELRLDQQAKEIEIVGIIEVSKHYE